MSLNGFKSILNSASFKKLWLSAAAEQGTFSTRRDLRFNPVKTGVEVPKAKSRRKAAHVTAGPGTTARASGEDPVIFVGSNRSQ